MNVVSSRQRKPERWRASVADRWLSLSAGRVRTSYRRRDLPTWKGRDDVCSQLKYRAHKIQSDIFIKLLTYDRSCGAQINYSKNTQQEWKQQGQE